MHWLSTDRYKPQKQPRHCHGSSPWNADRREMRAIVHRLQPPGTHEDDAPRIRDPRTERDHRRRASPDRGPFGHSPLVRRRRRGHPRLHPGSGQAGARRRAHLLRPSGRAGRPSRRDQGISRPAVRNRHRGRPDRRAGLDHARHLHGRPDGARRGRPRDHRMSGLAEHRPFVPDDGRRLRLRPPAARAGWMAARSRRRVRGGSAEHHDDLPQHPLQPHRLGHVERGAGPAPRLLPRAPHHDHRRRGLPPEHFRGRCRPLLPDRRRPGGSRHHRQRVLEGVRDDRLAARLDGRAGRLRGADERLLRMLQHGGAQLHPRAPGSRPLPRGSRSCGRCASTIAPAAGR